MPVRTGMCMRLDLMWLPKTCYQSFHIFLLSDDNFTAALLAPARNMAGLSCSARSKDPLLERQSLPSVSKDTMIRPVMFRPTYVFNNPTELERGKQTAAIVWNTFPA